MDCRAALERGIASAVFLCAAATQTAWNLARPAGTAPDSDAMATDAADVPAADQANDPLSIRVTATIRRALIADRTLSTAGHNALVVTNEHAVILRGPVASIAEEHRIDSLARQFAEGKDVRNQLTVSGV